MQDCKISCGPSAPFRSWVSCINHIMGLWDVASGIKDVYCCLFGAARLPSYIHAEVEYSASCTTDAKGEEHQLYATNPQKELRKSRSLGSVSAEVGLVNFCEVASSLAQATLSPSRQLSGRAKFGRVHQSSDARPLDVLAVS